VLPESEHLPPSAPEFGVRRRVSSADELHLPLPPLRVSTGKVVVIRATVPEATIDVNRQPSACKRDVDGAATVPRDLQLHPKPESASVKNAAQLHLRLRVASRQARHLRRQGAVGTDTCGLVLIRHGQPSISAGLNTAKVLGNARGHG